MQSMLAMANGQDRQQESARVRAMVDEVFTCLCRDFAKDSIVVQTSIPEDLQVDCVPIQMEQVLMNLVLNARDAMLPGGGILKIVAGEDGDQVSITVSDTGRGFPRSTCRTSSGPSSRQRRRRTAPPGPIRVPA
jgi:two-component system NtrC family sensor kinase